MKKFTSLFLTVLMVVFTLASNLTSLSAKAGEEFDPKSICEGVTITIAVPENTRISDWENNEETLYLEEQLGLDIKFEVYPAADYLTKLNAMVAAGDKLPDIIMNPGDAYKIWANEGALLELSEYYANPDLSANIRIASEGAGYDIGEFMKDGDGQIYGLPKLEQGYGMQSKQRFWVYEPWCEALGKEIPTTIEEYYEICKLIAENDMNGNGDTTDEKAIMGGGFNSADSGWLDWFEPLMSAYVYAYDSDFFIVSEDGVVGLAYETEEWKEGLKSIKRFFDDGLIGSSIFTNTMDDFKANLYTDLPTCFSFCGWIYEGSDADIKLNYNYTHLTDENGNNGYSQYMPILPAVGGVISADCENPEAAFLLCDLLCSEYVSFSTRYGREGEHWAYWDRVLAEDVLNPDDYAAQGGNDYEIGWVSSYKDSTFWSSTESTTASWLQTGIFIRNAATQLVRACMISASTPEDEKKILSRQLDYASKDAGIANQPPKVLDFAPLNADETAETAEILIEVNKYVEEMTAAFLTGKKDIDQEWDTYLAELKKLGTETLIQDYQTGYDRVH